MAAESREDAIAELQRFGMECGRSRVVLQTGQIASSGALAHGPATCTGLAVRHAPTYSTESPQDDSTTMGDTGGQ